jgi:hypothetical protein
MTIPDTPKSNILIIGGTGLIVEHISNAIAFARHANSFSRSGLFTSTNILFAQIGFIDDMRTRGVDIREVHAGFDTIVSRVDRQVICAQLDLTRLRMRTRM